MASKTDKNNEGIATDFSQFEEPKPEKPKAQAFKKPRLTLALIETIAADVANGAAPLDAALSAGATRGQFASWTRPAYRSREPFRSLQLGLERAEGTARATALKSLLGRLGDKWFETRYPPKAKSEKQDPNAADDGYDGISEVLRILDKFPEAKAEVAQVFKAQHAKMVDSKAPRRRDGAPDFSC